MRGELTGGPLSQAAAIPGRAGSLSLPSPPVECPHCRGVGHVLRASSRGPLADACAWCAFVEERMGSRAKQPHESVMYRGKPCPKNHDGLRYTAGGNCVECTKAQNRKRRARKARFITGWPFAARFEDTDARVPGEVYIQNLRRRAMGRG